MNAPRPIVRADCTSHVERSRPACKRGSEMSAESAALSMSVTFPRSRLPTNDEPIAGERGVARRFRSARSR